MSLFFYGVIILGIVLGGLVLLVLYSLLVMAKRGDECLDQLELEMLKSPEYAPPRIKSEKSKTSVCRPPLICTTEAPPEFGFSSDVESAKTLVGVHRLRFASLHQDPGLWIGKAG